MSIFLIIILALNIEFNAKAKPWIDPQSKKFQLAQSHKPIIEMDIIDAKSQFDKYL